MWRSASWCFYDPLSLVPRLTSLFLSHSIRHGLQEVWPQRRLQHGREDHRRRPRLVREGHWVSPPPPNIQTRNSVADVDGPAARRSTPSTPTRDGEGSLGMDGVFYFRLNSLYGDDRAMDTNIMNIFLRFYYDGVAAVCRER